MSLKQMKKPIRYKGVSNRLEMNVHRRMIHSLSLRDDYEIMRWGGTFYFSWKPPDTNCATICLMTAIISLNITIHLHGIDVTYLIYNRLCFKSCVTHNLK